MCKEFDARLDQGWWILRIGLGVGPFLAGLDKFFNLLANWPAYISPLALKILPFSGQTFMHIVGVIEMIVGLVALGVPAPEQYRKARRIPDAKVL